MNKCLYIPAKTGNIHSNKKRMLKAMPLIIILREHDKRLYNNELW